MRSAWGHAHLGWLMGRGWRGEGSGAGGNVLTTVVNPIQMERNRLSPRAGSKESHSRCVKRGNVCLVCMKSEPGEMCGEHRPGVRR